MTTVRERFPTMAGIAPLLAETSANLKDQINLMRLTAAVSTIPRSAYSGGGSEAMEASAALLVSELRRARTSPNEREIDLLLLAATSFPLEQRCSRAQIDKAWKWAVAPAVDTTADPKPGETSTDLALPFNAVTTAPMIGIDLLIRWVGSVCYMAWAHAYLSSEATSLMDHIDGILDRSLEGSVSPQRVVHVSHIAVWQHRTRSHDPTNLMVRLEAICSDKTQDRDTQIAAARALATAVGELSGTSRQDRASQALGRFSDLRPTERLHFLTTCVSGSAELAVERFGELESAIDDYVDWVAATAGDPLEVALARGREWGLLVGAISDLIGAGEVDRAVWLAGRWFGLREGSSRHHQVLVTMREFDSVLWACEGTAERATADHTTMLRMMNEVLDTSLVDPADPAPQIHRPKRRGQPDLTSGPELIDALEGGLRPNVGTTVAMASGSQPKAVLNLSFERAPITWMLASANGPVLPVIASMQEPLTDRGLRKAEIWVGDLLGAEEECDAVASVLRDAGCEVELVDALGAGVGAFRESYERDDLDLLWVSGHAEFGHDWVEKTVLKLATGADLLLRDLMALRAPDAGRRLLVLNSCESGISAGLGGPSTVGIGSFLAGAGQAVISNLWLAGYREAARFGVLLALGLAEHKGFVQGFELALRPLIAGPDSVRDRLRTHPAGATLAELWDPAATTDFVAVGSPCFLE